MAIAKQCDRCGVFYLRNTFHTGVLSSINHTGFKYIWSDGDDGERVDLCDDCQAALEKFMDEGGKDRKENKK